MPDNNGTPQRNGRPDPTILTTQQTLRENAWLREVIETRVAAIDKAILLLQSFADRTPTTMDVQHQTLALREVMMEKFSGIKTQLEDRDSQTEKAARDVKSAVDAALSAAKEAVGEQNKSNTLSIAKSEDGFTKQLDALNEMIKNTSKGVDDKISDIKDRITSIESKTSVSDPSTAIDVAALKASVSRLSSSSDTLNGRGAGAAALWGLIVGGVGLLMAIGTFLTVVFKMMR